MRMMLISLIVVACIGLRGSENKQTKTQQLNKQIAVLESKVFALKNENKKLKVELQKKNNAISTLAMRIAGQPAKGKNQSNRTVRSRGYDPVEAQRKASQLAAEQQKKQRARQLAIINQKIKYYGKQKSEFEKQYTAATKKVKDAKSLIGKSRRKEAIREALRNQKKIKRKISNTDYSIDSLKKQRFNYL